PDTLANVVDVLTVQLVAEADVPHQRRVPLDDLVPCLLVAVAYAGDQGYDRRVVMHTPSPRLYRRPLQPTSTEGARPRLIHRENRFFSRPAGGPAVRRPRRRRSSRPSR